MTDELLRLRDKAERLLDAEGCRADVELMLERIVALAPRISDDALFAHRHLAELRIERHPWRAALHVRSALAVAPDDDRLHALMGLCQALLGNYRTSVESYRRAVQHAPQNAWYHHNLGHLLDVALSQPADALVSLRAAYKLEPLEDEISASLAHCLALLGQVDEARKLAVDALGASPENAHHRAIVEWIARGAPSSESPHARPLQDAFLAEGSAAQSHELAVADAVTTLLEAHMREAGFNDHHRARATSMWADFRRAHPSRVVKPSVAAAAVEYAMIYVNDLRQITRKDVARRYGVPVNSLVARYTQIREALRLDVRDPRYA